MVTTFVNLQSNDVGAKIVRHGIRERTQRISQFYLLLSGELADYRP